MRKIEIEEGQKNLPLKLLFQKKMSLFVVIVHIISEKDNREGSKS